MGLRVGMVSLGCPKNQMDAELMLGKLQEAGIEITPDSGLADVVIVNTCGFIEDAKREAIDNILEFAQLKKEGQIRRIIVTGCLAERYRQELADELPECDAVLTLGANGDIVETVRAVMRGERVLNFAGLECWSMEGHRLQTTPSFFAYLRIGDGCDNRCAYCAIPSIRGRMHSRTPEAILTEARELAANGVKELILVAQDVTRYGRDLGGDVTLPDLLEQLCRVDGLRWIRMLYCYPEHITDRLLDVMAREEKLVPYLDIPIQHVNGRVLRSMHRPGGADTLRALMEKIRRRLPDVTLRTTVMTGFPGETEEEFTELCEFLREHPFERLGCFAFSPEEGTEAAAMDGQIEPEEKQRRRDIVMEQQMVLSDRYNQSRIGRTVEVLVEAYDRYAECWFGRSAADAPDIDGKVFFTTKTPVHPGDFVRVTVTDCMDWDLMGEQTDESAQ